MDPNNREESSGEFASLAIENIKMIRELKNSEERFRSVTETAADAIISINSKGIIILWNKAAERIFGYTTDEAVGKSVQIIIPEADYINHKMAFSNVVKTGKSNLAGRTLELFARKKDGVLFPVELSLAVYKVDKELYFTGIIRDITKRKRYENALKESQEKYQTLFNNVNDAIILLERHSDGTPKKFIEANNIACDFLGYEKSELCSMIPNDLVAAECSHNLADIHNTMLEQGKHIYEITFVAKSGKKIPVEISGHLFKIKIGCKKVELSVVRDITERKNAEERKWYHLFKHSRIIVLFIDLDGNIVQANDAAVKAYGYSDEQLHKMKI